jgi:hypothetical protein
VGVERGPGGHTWYSVGHTLGRGGPPPGGKIERECTLTSHSSCAGLHPNEIRTIFPPTILNMLLQ